MAASKRTGLAAARSRKLAEAMEALRDVGFAPKQSNEVAGYTLLALLDLKPTQAWADASNPLRGITPIIDFVAEAYGVRYAPNTRETIRDEAVKFFVEAVTSAGPVDGKRRKELKELFSGCKAGLVFVTAFASRAVMRSFLGSISWETEVWIADEPDHMMHFDGERFLGPYPDVTAPADSPVVGAADQRSRT